MALTLEQVQHIARLARLELTPEEQALYREQLSAILDYAEMLNSVPTQGIAPTFSVLPPENRLRADTPRPGLAQAELLRNAPQCEGELLRLPPVFE
jgi:aspartyl-tRNA(Asn)/glutamyl-tRNA(Gln) amidotransferase subunit C